MEIELHKGGQIVAKAIVDDDCSSESLNRRWTLNSGYAATHVKNPKGQQSWLYLHRLLSGLSFGDTRQADHINRNRLDCRKANLRVLTPAQNQQNTPKRIHGSSQYRGVFFDKKWRAAAKLNGKRTYIGTFATEIEAAKAASDWRRANMPFSNEEAA